MIAIRNRLSIHSQPVLCNLGYSAESELTPRISALVDEYIGHANELIEPMYSYTHREVARVQGDISIIEGRITFKSQVIARLLASCQQVAVFVLTIGNRLEEMVSHLAREGLVLQATVLDAIGSAAVEALAVFVQERISELAGERGLCVSRRFSPGYCDWNIRQQRTVFRAMGEDHAGVCLNKKCLMLPQKSVSGVIGIGPCGTADRYNPCPTCNQHDCTGRRLS